MKINKIELKEMQPNKFGYSQIFKDSNSQNKLGTTLQSLCIVL